MGREKGEPFTPPDINNGEKPSLPTAEELQSKTLRELLELRGEFEEKLDYLRKHNPDDEINEILQANEEYHRMIEQIIKAKMQSEKTKLIKIVYRSIK